MSLDFIVICRQLIEGTADDLRPGNTAGHRCVICGQALQLSPVALAALARGGRPFCHPCGLNICEKYTAEKVPVDTILGPNAVDQLIERFKRGLNN